MVNAQIITRWIQVDRAGNITAEPALFSDVPPAEGDSWTDVTQQPAENIVPSPDVVVIEVLVSDATFAAILAHVDYGPGAVLWSETL